MTTTENSRPELVQETRSVGPGCLVCGSPMAVGECDGRRAKGESLFHCASCGMFLERTHSGAYAPPGSISESYERLEYSEAAAIQTSELDEKSFWYRHRNRVLDVVLERFPANGTLWDVGGGNGFQALHFQRRGRPVVLVEPGPMGAQFARTRGVTHVLQATLEALHLPKGALSAISLLDVLEHIPDPRPMLSECLRVLAPGGRLYVTVPAYDLLWSDEDVFAQHQRRYTQASLRRELEREGFEIDLLSSYFQCLLLPLFLLRTLPYRVMPWSRKHAGTGMDRSEHELAGPSLAVVDYFLSRELGALRRGETIRYGTSVLAVARRPGSLTSVTR